MEYVTEDLGYSQAPIIVVDDHFHWAGLRPDLIEQVATLQLAPYIAELKRLNERYAELDQCGLIHFSPASASSIGRSPLRS